MEQELTKGRIIELYLNVVELGPMVYGIGHGAQYYFGKPASALTPRESAFLAAMLPGPRLAYNPYKKLGRVLQRSDMILRLMRQKGVLSEAEYQTAVAQTPNVGRLQQKVDKSIQEVAVFTTQSSAQGPVEPLPPADEPPAADEEKPLVQEQQKDNDFLPSPAPSETAPIKQ